MTVKMGVVVWISTLKFLVGIYIIFPSTLTLGFNFQAQKRTNKRTRQINDSIKEKGKRIRPRQKKS
jgi:hypothetical protein